MESFVRSILLVDHDKQNRLTLAAKLRKEIGALVLEAKCPEEAIRVINGTDISLLITDIFLPDKSGIELMKAIRQQCPGVVSVMGIPEGNRDAIVEALNAGALFYINAPYDLDEAVIVAARSLAHHDLVKHHEPTGPKIRKSEGFHGIIGKAPVAPLLIDGLKRLEYRGYDSAGLAVIDGQGLVIQKSQGKIARLDGFVRDNPVTMTLLIRLLPGSNIATNLAAGVSSVPVLPFLLGTVFGYLPQTIVFALVGSGVNVDPGWRSGLGTALFVASGILGVYLFRRLRHGRHYDVELERQMGDTGDDEDGLPVN